jgi:hypothetical protein
MFEKIAFIILVNFVFFFKTLSYKYSSDDIPVYQSPPKYRNEWEKRLFWLDGRMRINPLEDHALTSFIHALICVFIYLGFGKDNLSFIASLLFAFNPTNNQGSVWISGRAYALAALGMTGAMAFPMLALPFLLISGYTNHGFFAPIALLGSSYLPYFWWAAIASWGVNFKRFAGNVKHKTDKEMFPEDRAIKWQKLIVATKTFGYYTTLSIVPFCNAFYHSFLQTMTASGKEKAYSIKDRFFWIGLLMIIGTIYYFIKVPWNIASLGLLWWCVCIGPFCNFFRMSQEIAERYCYLPMVGLMVFLSSFICNDPILIATFISIYATRLWFLMDMYQDDYYLLEYSCVLDPKAWFCWHMRAVKRWDNQSIKEALIIWTMARLISPKEFKLNFNIAVVLHVAGHKKEALEYLKIAEDNTILGQEKDAKRLIDNFRNGDVSTILI